MARWKARRPVAGSWSGGVKRKRLRRWLAGRGATSRKLVSLQESRFTVWGSSGSVSFSGCSPRPSSRSSPLKLRHCASNCRRRSTCLLWASALQRTISLRGRTMVRVCLRKLRETRTQWSSTSTSSVRSAMYWWSASMRSSRAWQDASRSVSAKLPTHSPPSASRHCTSSRRPSPEPLRANVVSWPYPVRTTFRRPCSCIFLPPAHTHAFRCPCIHHISANPFFITFFQLKSSLAQQKRMSHRQNAEFVERHLGSTIAEVKALYFGGQGQPQQSTALWQDHLQLRREELLEDLQRHMQTPTHHPELRISQEKYALLQRYHRTHPTRTTHPHHPHS